MNEMLERVARTICCMHWLGRKPHSEPCDCVAWKDHLPEAEAVIEAMREPTKPMVKAMCRAMSPDRRPVPEHVGVERKHAIRWEAGVAAALGEKWPPSPDAALGAGQAEGR